MKPSKIKGIFEKNNKIFTENLRNCKGIRVYNEKLFSYKGNEYRSWNPYRSKFAAAILKGLENINIKPDSQVLYLGAATGTTVSHFSDIVKEGMVYAVENSPISVKKLLESTSKRHNLIPILSDANHPDRYCSIVPFVDILYQDISQRNQADIFINNISKYLKKNSQGLIMVKARSIDVSLQPKKVYEIVTDKLEEHNLKIVDIFDLSPYEKDHAAILISN